jgi:type IV secretory pathway VirB4 component
MFYEKQDRYEVIKELTFHIGNTGANIKTTFENQTDIDVLSGSYYDAKYIRKQIQLNNEELFYLYSYVLIYAETQQELELNIQKVEGICMGIGLQTRRATFREEQAFFSCLPILKNNTSIKEVTRRNVLASGLSSTYPFLSNELCDDNGIFIGLNKINNSIVMINRFNSEKYSNPNMCIIGTSGSGKSYLSKLLISRNRYLNINQFVIDPDGEYTKICNELGGIIIRFGTSHSINIMDIREREYDDEISYLQNKINNLNAFFSLIFKDITLFEKALLEEKLIECYKQKGITFDDKSLYREYEEGKIQIKQRFKGYKEMPILGDLFKILNGDKKCKRLSTLLKPFISGRLKYYNNYTNIDLLNKIVVSDINGIDEENLPIILFIITEFYWDHIKKDRNERKIIYLDEAWRLIYNNSDTANFILKLFKTVRKYGGAVTAITQDINDFFALEEGKYGKGLINNSSFKCIFQLEENNQKVLKDIVNLSDEEMFKLKVLKRGECLLCAGREHILTKVEASKREHEIIVS